MDSWKTPDSVLEEKCLQARKRVDSWATAACYFMRLTSRIGYGKALAKEVEDPCWNNPDWCRFVVGAYREELTRPAEQNRSDQLRLIRGGKDAEPEQDE